jgi:23S rRNA pseudouridine2604 synthase
MTEPVRLAKRLADMLACSRREAEQYIEGGFVTVDGVVVEEPQFRVQSESIVVSQGASLLALSPVTILLHKPAGYESRDAAHASGDAGIPTAMQLLTAANQAPGDRSGIRPLKKHFSSAELLTPLATAASGLVVFSGDWRVVRKLREDARQLEHEVVVEVSGNILPGGLERLNRIDHGFSYQGALLPPAKVSWQSEKRLRFALKGELPGQIAYLCESVGLQVTAMKRLRVGRMPLSQLPVGQWRYLMPYERF